MQSQTEAERCGMFYVNERWLGGMLTNFKTIQSRINRLKEIEAMQEDGTFDVLPKKEVINLKKEMEKLTEEPWRYQGNEEDFRMQSLSLTLRRKESVYRKHRHLASR